MLVTNETKNSNIFELGFELPLEVIKPNYLHFQTQIKRCKLSRSFANFFQKKPDQNVAPTPHTPVKH